MESLKPYFEIAPDAGAEEVVVMIPADGFNLVASEAYCTNPACECNEVMLMAITMDESGKSGKPVFSFRLDLSTWKVTAENVIDKEIGARNIIGDFVQGLGDEAKVRFAAHWRAAKDYGRQHYLDYLSKNVIDAIAKGLTLYYEDIFGSVNAERLTFNYGNDQYLISDQYCINPDCLCNDAYLQFVKIDPRKRKQGIYFAVKLQLTNYNYEFLERKCPYEEAFNIVSYVRKNRPEILKVLKRRYAEMKTAGKAIRKRYGPAQETRAIRAAAGRNDPCPCGSGKKYKKCCGR
ncbi:MAG: SEC-C metal-binding domain-containing protein [Peptococcaceae bacterium]|jgi:hypothetical protein|nr:SEC-C metal-binding domain-containing protein [Peptococcaceae bacterium]